MWFEQLEPGLRVRPAVTRTVTEAELTGTVIQAGAAGQTGADA